MADVKSWLPTDESLSLRVAVKGGFWVGCEGYALAAQDPETLIVVLDGESFGTPIKRNQLEEL